MTEKAEDCAHPRRCPDDDSFFEKIKTDKLALDTPPPDLLVKPPK